MHTYPSRLSNGTVEVMKTQHLNPELGQTWDEIKKKLAKKLH